MTEVDDSLTSSEKLELDFQSAAEAVTRLTLTDEDVLELYGLYQQATVGDNNTGKPLDAKEIGKWEEWNNRNGMSREDAKRAYIEKVKSLGGFPIPKFVPAHLTK